LLNSCARGNHACCGAFYWKVGTFSSLILLLTRTRLVSGVQI
jgi:hypothetical protein